MGTGAIAGIVLAVLVLLTILTGLRTVNQGTVAVTTIFGKYRRTLRPGLNVVVPFIEKIFRRISVQNRAVELQFQAITFDQANVYFTAMMVYGAISETEETVKNIAFKFVSEKDFLTALVRSVEGSTRGFVATKKQAEILVLRAEIVAEVKDNLDHVIETWGFHLIDLQLNDITFDQAITTSMRRSWPATTSRPQPPTKATRYSSARPRKPKRWVPPCASRLRPSALPPSCAVRAWRCSARRWRAVSPRPPTPLIRRSFCFRCGRRRFARWPNMARAMCFSSTVRPKACRRR